MNRKARRFISFLITGVMTLGLFATLPGIGVKNVEAVSGIPIDEAHFPDANFRSFILNDSPEVGYDKFDVNSDGYWLGSDGAWVESYSGGKWSLDSTGWWYSDSSGWYPANQWLWIDGTNYNFNSKGYCTNP